jgi:hypothetical protein
MADTMPEQVDYATSADTSTLVTARQRPRRLSPSDLDWHVLTQWVTPALFQAPGLDWERVEVRNIRYLRNVFVDNPQAPWGNALAFVALVMTCHAERDPQTVYGYLTQLHARWRTLFPAYGLTHFHDWQPVDHLPRYIRDQELQDTMQTRGYFVQGYETVSLAADGYLRTLPARQQAIYQSWAPEPIPHDMAVHLGVPIRRVVDAEMRERRRRAADAVTPHFARIRSEAHLRWNQLWRLREQYRQAVARVEAGEETLPLAFSYDEPATGQRLDLVLWNRRSWVLAHPEVYSARTVQKARQKAISFIPQREHYFLEFVQSAPVHEAVASPQAGGVSGPDLDGDLLWFGELIREHALGHPGPGGSAEQSWKRQMWLRSWGYGDEGDLGDVEEAWRALDGPKGRKNDLTSATSEAQYTDRLQEAERRARKGGSLGEKAPRTVRQRKGSFKHLISPFRTDMPGLLIWPRETAGFLDEAQNRTDRLLFLVEPLFAAATFGLAVLDLLTTAGPRMHELLQVQLTPECLCTLEVDGRAQLILRLDPKGSNGQPVDFFVGPEIKRDFEKVRRLLQEHYRLASQEPLPTVAYTTQSTSRHRFQARPYLFQYRRQALHPNSITACVRFLCHGLVFQRPDGRAVVLGAHLLRHVFATHLHQVEKVPLDIVAALLHHKNLRITHYYSAPTREQVLEQHRFLLDTFATHLGDLDTAAARLPEDLQAQLEEARTKVGPLNRVPGGTCTCWGVCPIAFECVGCAYLVPDPTYRTDIVERRQAAEYWLRRAEALCLRPEVTKMRALIQQTDVVLKEMDLMESYRDDEQYQPAFRAQ